LRLRELPVRWNHDKASKVVVFRDTFRMLDEVRRIRRNVMSGVYEHAIDAAMMSAKTHTEKTVGAISD
jgi:hypothetical protein